MKKKQVVDFLTMKPAFSSRNVTSLVLVGVFFGVYILSGGKISAPPKVDPRGGFGSIALPDGVSPSITGDVEKLPAARALFEQKKPEEAALATREVPPLVRVLPGEQRLHNVGASEESEPAVGSVEKQEAETEPDNGELKSILDRLNRVRPASTEE